MPSSFTGFFNDILGVNFTKGDRALAAAQFVTCMVCILIVLVETFQKHEHNLARQIVFMIVFLYIALCVYRSLKKRMFGDH